MEKITGVLLGLLVILVLLGAYQDLNQDSGYNKHKRFVVRCHNQSGVIIDGRCVQVKVIENE